MSDPRNAVFAAIGSALHQWSGVEFALAGLFEIISGITNPKRSNAVFDTIISFETRVDVIDTLMGLEGLSELERETWNRLSLKLKKKYKKRHELAHFSVIPNLKGMDAALKPFYTLGAIMRDETKSLSLTEIGDRQKSFAELHEAVNWFKFEMMARHGLLASNPMPTPQTVLRCQESAVLILEERARKRTQSQPGGAVG